MDFDLTASDWNTGAEQDWVYGDYGDYGNYNDLILSMSWKSLNKITEKIFKTLSTGISCQSPIVDWCLADMKRLLIFWFMHPENFWSFVLFRLIFGYSGAWWPSNFALYSKCLWFDHGLPRSKMVPV